MSFLISDAWAQVGGEGGGGFLSLLPLVIIFVLFYFLLIRTQQKRATQQKEMVASVKKGDDVATNGGLVGRVVDLDDNFVTLEIAKGVNVKVQRPAIGQMIPKGSAAGS